MRLAIAFATSAFLTCPVAMAQDYPAKPMRLVIPNSPGGSLDVAARLVQPRLQELLGQPLVLDYRVAAGGVVGTNQVAQSTPDGYTLIMVFDSFVTNSFLFDGVQYDPVKSFEPVSLMLLGVQAMLTPPGSGIRNFADYLRLAREKGNAVNFGTAGPGTSSRFTMELFRQTTGTDATPIHFKGGGPLVTAIMGGQVDAAIITAGVAMSQIRSGKLRPIAVMSSKRSRLMPDVPTVAETYPGFEAQSWQGLLAPLGTPRPIVDRLNDAMTRTLATPEVKSRFEELSYDVVATPPAEFGAWIRTETAKWGKVIKDRNIKLEQ